MRTEERAKAGPSTTLRSGRDDNSFARSGLFLEYIGKSHNKIVIPTEVVMGLQPTQGDENPREAPVSNQRSNLREAPPSDLSSRPERSEVEGSAVLSPLIDFAR